jgi:hypothetical protein
MPPCLDPQTGLEWTMPLSLPRGRMALPGKSDGQPGIHVLFGKSGVVRLCSPLRTKVGATTSFTQQRKQSTR